MSVGSLPEQGQLVEVRERRWVVAEIEADELRGDPLQPAVEPEHLVTLRSVEDDAEPARSSRSHRQRHLLLPNAKTTAKLGWR
jgi:hypothetical protein